MKELVRSAVVESLGEMLSRPIDSFAETDDLVNDLGLDSLNVVNLLGDIEHRLTMRFPDGREAELVGTKTVRDLVERLATVFFEAP